MRRRLLPVIITLLCVMICVFAACKNTVAVEGITLNKTELTLDIGVEETLTATVTPDNATDKTVTWSSDNADVATVKDGKVTAVAAGTATITAKADGKSATCTVTVNAPAPISEVTAEQWAQIFENATNYTWVFTTPSGESMRTLKSDGTNISMSLDDYMYPIIQIIEKNGNEYHVYNKDDGNWTRESVNEEDFTDPYRVNYIELQDKCVHFLTNFKSDYSSFTYSGGKYINASIDKTDTPLNLILNDVEIIFENGALVSITFTVGDNEDTTIVEVKDIGTTTITIPTDYTESGDESTTEVTAEQWAQIMESTDNFALRMVSGANVMTYLIDGTTRMQTMDAYAKIFVKDGDEYYTYDNFSGGWVKYKRTVSEYSETDFQAEILTYFRDDYNSFDYKDGKYCADYLDKSSTINSKIYNVEIQFENGALVSLSFTNEDGSSSCEVFKVGEAEITLPAEYTDLVPKT